MKTPDEIKKGLECVGGLIEPCVSGCPYEKSCECGLTAARDAIEYIQQLEYRLAQVERERDAAVAEIKRMEDKAKELFETEIHDVIFRELSYNDYMDFINQVEQICNYQFEHEWRGVREENTKEEST